MAVLTKKKKKLSFGNSQISNVIYKTLVLHCRFLVFFARRNLCEISYISVIPFLQTAEQNSEAIKEWALCYKPVATHVGLLYFALADMAAVSPMYRFSLAAFRALFQQSLSKAPKSDKIQDRIRHLTDHFTHAFLKYAMR